MLGLMTARVSIFVIVGLAAVAFACSARPQGTTEPATTLDAEAAEKLEVWVADVASIGQVVRVRGNIRNLFDEPVEGVVYRVRFLSRRSDEARVLQVELIPRHGLKLAPGERKIVSLDVESMYVNLKAGSNFLVDAWPMKLGGRPVALPSDWK
jgi:hypothetical protein